jgi:sugar phosphate permease
MTSRQLDIIGTTVLVANGISSLVIAFHLDAIPPATRTLVGIMLIVQGFTSGLLSYSLDRSLRNRK